MYFSGLVVQWLFSRCYIVNPRTYLKFITPLWYKGEGGGVDGTPSQSFLMLQYFETICLRSFAIFDLSSIFEPLIFSTRWGIFYFGGLWCHKNGSHLGCYLGFYQVLEIRLKHHFINKLCFYCWKKLKKHEFSLKNGLTRCYLWCHSLNLSNWTSLKWSQNVLEG